MRPVRQLTKQNLFLGYIVHICICKLYYFCLLVCNTSLGTLHNFNCTLVNSTLNIWLEFLKIIISTCSIYNFAKGKNCFLTSVVLQQVTTWMYEKQLILFEWGYNSLFHWFTVHVLLSAPVSRLKSMCSAPTGQSFRKWRWISSVDTSWRFTAVFL